METASGNACRQRSMTSPGPALLIGMDTPQVTAAQLGDAVLALADAKVDSVLGPTADGGYWCVGFSGSVPGRV